MLLAVDVGNTETLIGMFRDRESAERAMLQHVAVILDQVVHTTPVLHGASPRTERARATPLSKRYAASPFVLPGDRKKSSRFA